MTREHCKRVFALLLRRFKLEALVATALQLRASMWSLSGPDPR